jgi:hypothetical protein
LRQKHTKTALLKSESKKTDANGWERTKSESAGKRKTFETAEEILFPQAVAKAFS